MTDLQRELTIRLQQVQNQQQQGYEVTNDNDIEDRVLFDFAVRIYCQRLGADVYSAYYDVSI